MVEITLHAAVDHTQQGQRVGYFSDALDARASLFAEYNQRAGNAPEIGVSGYDLSDAGSLLVYRRILDDASADKSVEVLEDYMDALGD